MPLSPSSRALSVPRRRTLLASAAGTVLGGCSGGGQASGTGDGGSSAAERVRARAAQDSRELVARYDAVLAAHPDLAQRLRPLRAEVVAHAEAFEGGTSDRSPAPSPSSAASAAPAAAGGADRTKALAALAAAERGLADRRAKALLEVPGELARLLASVAGAGAAHAYLLTDGDG